MSQNKAIKFILSALVSITVFTAVVLGSYLIIEKQFGIPEEVLKRAQEVIAELRNKSFEQKLKVQERETVITNLIIKAPEEGGIPEVFLLEVMNTASGKLLLLTLPGDSQVTLSNELYVSLQSEMPTVPQILLLETIFKLAETEKAGRYAKRMLEDVLGITITSCTVLPEAVFIEYLAIGSDGVVRISEEVKELMNRPVTVRGSRDLFLALYETEGFFSELTYEENSWYLEYYEGLTPASVTAVMAEGEQKNEAFFLDVFQVRQMVYNYY